MSTKKSVNKVSIVMGSQSDFKTMKFCQKLLKVLKIKFETKIISAHRTPERMFEYAKKAEKNGISVIIAGAGGSAHLPGMIAAITSLPVLGVPIESKKLKGLDSLLSIAQMSSEEERYFDIPTSRTVLELRNILEEKYDDILKIDFEKKENNQNFWFISKNKEEPRLADRFKENGSELEQPLAIARDIKKLYKKISVYKNSSTIDKFLVENSDLRHVVRRAFIVEKFPYSEIQDNTIGKSIVPIDMLRLKLSFFGALKFDPRSDKWLRICMFQGAPLPGQLKNYDDHWVYNSLN